MNRLSLWTVMGCFAVQILLHDTLALDNCTWIGENETNAGSCTFEQDACGWGLEYNDNVNWTIEYITGNKFLFGNMTHQTVNSTFSTASPRLCSRENITALFRFRLFTGGCNTYAVHVYLRSTSDVSCLLWSGQSTYREMSPEIRINNTLCNNSVFRILITGMRLETNTCEGDGLYLDDIEMISPDVSLANTKENDVTHSSSQTKTDNSSCINTIACTFEESSCGWQTAAGFGLQWNLQSTWYSSNHFLTLVMENQKPNSTSWLESTWICPNGLDQYSLKFSFYYGNKNNCQLSVLLITERNTSQKIWTGNIDTFLSFHQLKSSIQLDCSECGNSKFKIVFEGKKLKGESCGSFYDEIDVDDIEYSKTGLKSTTLEISSNSFITSTHRLTSTHLVNSTTTTTTQHENISTSSPGSSLTLLHGLHETELTVTTTKSTDSINMTSFYTSVNIPGITNIANMSGPINNSITNEGNNQYLSTGGVAAVVATVIVAVIIFVVIVIVLRRRQLKRDGVHLRNGNPEPESRAQELLQAGNAEMTIVNTIYHADDANITGSLTDTNHENVLMNGCKSATHLNSDPSVYYSTICPRDEAVPQTTSDDVKIKNINHESEESYYNKVILDASSVLRLSKDDANTYDHAGH